MILLLASLAHADSTLHLSTSEEVTLKVNGAAYGLKPRKEADVKLAAGSPVLEGPDYKAQLELPDEVEVWLSWDGQQLVLTDAKTKAQVRAGKAMKVGNAAMAAGAAAQQAQSTKSDLQAAGSDFEAAQKGELTESSHTEVEVNIGSDGISSSSSRTTAGAEGVQSHSSSTSIGPGGVSQSQGSASLTGAGYSEQSSSTTVGFVQLDGGIAVKLTLLDEGIESAPAVAEAAPVEAAPEPEEKKAEKIDPDHANWYKPANSTAGEITARGVDPFLKDEGGKLALHVDNGSGDFLALYGHEATGRIGGQELAANGGKVKAPKIVEAKDKGKVTLAFVGSGLHVEEWELDLEGVVVRVPGEGEVLDPGAFSLAGNTSFDEAGLSCTVTSLKKKTKETSGKLACDWTGEGYLLVDGSKLAVHMGEQDHANGARNKGVKVLAPGEDIKVAFSWEVAARIEDMQFAEMPLSWRDTFQVAQGTPVQLKALSLQLDPGKTDAEN